MTHPYTLSQINEAAKWLLGGIGSARVVCLQGEMGAGKTTLIQALCRQLGTAGSFGSPTFPIIHEYALKNEGGSVYHMDLYRLSSAREAERTGVVDALDSGSLCLVEWPERLPEIIPPDALWVNIQVVDTEQRCLRLLNK